MKRLAAVALGMVLVIGMTAACGSDKDEEADTSTTAAGTSSSGGDVKVVAKEFAFDAPAQISGGLVNLTVENPGKEHHQAVAVKLAPGKTLADYSKYFSETNPQGPPPGATVAGVTGVVAGATGHGAFKLDPGNYLWACFLPSTDGLPHIAKGMVQPFTVSGDNGKAVPAASPTVEGTEFSYPNLPSLKSGANTFTFANKGTQDHEAALVEVAPGKTADDVKAYFSTETPSGPPPMTEAGGAAAGKGISAVTTVTLDASKKYLFICLIPDPADGKPHIVKGMLAEVKVT